MTCVHLRRLYELCRQSDLKLAGSDLIHFICEECGEKEVCPSEMMDQLPDDEDNEQDGAEPTAGDSI